MCRLNKLSAMDLLFFSPFGHELCIFSDSGLKTVISELPPASTALAASICKKITGRLTSAIAKVG